MLRIGGTTLELVQGDITTQDVDAIVNAANSSLMGGGGVDGAIHRAGGTAILEECKQIRAQRGEVPPGQAVITTAGDLQARHVIHTVGPIWRGGQRGEPELLRSCYRAAMQLAREHGCQSMAFPSVSTGAYRYPLTLAAPIALNTVVAEVVAHPRALALVRFVLFDAATLEAYEDALADLDTVIGGPL